MLSNDNMADMPTSAPQQFRFHRPTSDTDASSSVNSDSSPTAGKMPVNFAQNTLPNRSLLLLPTKQWNIQLSISFFLLRVMAAVLVAVAIISESLSA